MMWKMLKPVLCAGVLILGLPTAGHASDFPLDAPVDFSGVWMPTVIAPNGERHRAWPENPPFKPEVQKEYEAYQANMAAHPEDFDAARNCLPYGMPYQMLLVAQYPIEMIQTQDRLTIIFELHNDVRRVYMDGREAPTGVLPTWMGYSTGEWEGDELVIHTSSIREGAFPRPHGPRFTVTERLRRITAEDGREMIVDEMIIDDPDTYTEPFTVTTYFHQIEGLELGEYFCSEDIWRLNLSGQENAIPWR